jgi:ATP-binding cassette, subfamily B, multidrug efflux pump
MLKLIKNLKPYTWTIILIFGLLFGQAMTDLSLPSYMSDIVNIGIQQKGIENAAPDVIRAGEMNKLQLFMSESDKAVVTADYILLDKARLSQSEYDSYLKSYPDLANEPLYRLNTTDKAEINKLSGIFGKPMLVVYMIETNNIPASAGFTLPSGVDVFQYFQSLPADQQQALLTQVSGALSSVPDSMVTQSASTYIYTEYTTIGVDVSGVQNRYIMHIGLIMIGLALAGAVASVSVGFLASWIAAAFSRDTRRKLFQKVNSFSNIEIDKFSTASLITRTTNDVLQIQMLLVIMMRMLFYAPILGIGAIVKILGESLSLSWIIMVAIGAILLLIGVVFAIAIPKFRIIQKLIDRLNLVSREFLSGIMVVRAFNTQKYEEKRFDEANVELTNTNLFINKVMVFMMPAMMLVMNGTMLLIIWFGAKQIDTGSLQIGSMMAFMQYAMQIIMAFLFVSMMFIMLPRAAVSAGRISQVLETEPVIKDPEKAKEFAPEFHGQVEFKNVSFKYPGAEDYVLHGISFTARPGQTTAFIGSTGSGKSTLINLIPRFYDVTEGNVLVDNTDIREVSQHKLREKIGFVPQKSNLFTGTIESNIKYGKEDASEAEVQKAAAIAQSLDFISESEKGFQTDIAQNGSNLSGGQRQRISIARALAKKPEIFVFDDSFSAVDFKTDAALRRALKKETGDSTVLIVAQRISTIMYADQIVVLDNGRVAGVGTHKELMAGCEVYRELALSQLSKEELAS